MTAKQPHNASSIVDHLFRQQSGKMTAILLRIFGFQNSELIEDIIQDTFLSALKVWGMKGAPENPEAWLMLVAKNKIINELNSAKRRAEKREKVRAAAHKEEIEELFLDHEIKDSQMRLLFACCDPELSPKDQIMLTLKVLSGFGNREIANALFMTPAAVKKRIYRARQQLARSNKVVGIPFMYEVSGRFTTVLTILYLIFNEGYKPSTGEQILNEELCLEAIRLAQLLPEMPEGNKGQVNALLALMYFTLSRFEARTDDDGGLLDIEHQDRSKWNSRFLEQGFRYLKSSRISTSLSKYHFEATIAATHCSALTFQSTDWSIIVYCYEELLRLERSVLMRINHAVAVGYLRGPAAGFDLLKKIEQKKPSDKALLFAAMGKLNADLEQYKVAGSYYQVALDHCNNKADCQFLSKRLAACEQADIHSN